MGLLISRLIAAESEQSTLRDSLAIAELTIVDRNRYQDVLDEIQTRTEKFKVRKINKLCCDRLQRPISDRVAEFRNSGRFKFKLPLTFTDWRNSLHVV